MAPEGRVLIVTNTEDAHADHVTHVMGEENIGFLRLNTDRLMTDYRINLYSGHPQDATIAVSGDVHRCRDFHAVWFRRPVRPIPGGSLPEHAREYVVREAEELLETFYYSLSAQWVSHPLALRRAARKYLQLERARHLGFRVPPTLVTYDAQAVRDFFDSHPKGVVVKTLNTPFVHDGERGLSLMTNILTREHLQQSAQLELAPLVVQELLPKRYELRVTVIGDEVFPVVIDSQASERTALDWRRGVFYNIPQREHNLPSEIEDRCRKMVKSFDLLFSSMDLVVGSDGEYYFLDLNPNGQWLWMEYEVGIPLTSAMMRLFKKLLAV